MDDIASDGRDLVVSSNGGDWRVGWYPPPDPPSGTPHGAAAVCVSGNRIVLVSSDGQRWGLPGGRPEQGERWAGTLRREVARGSLRPGDRRGSDRRMFVEAGFPPVDLPHRSSAAAALASRSLVPMTVPPELTGRGEVDPQAASGPNSRKKS
jgi:NUDIX domain